ncbi:MAG: class III extradiol ring-cleavage dioxygenase [Rhizomicrobium sp.]
MQPVLFLSHGAPTLPFDSCAAGDFLRALGHTLKKPKAIIAVSAHWDTPTPMLNAPLANRTIHDFYGFPKPLYDLRYEPPGAMGLANQIGDRLAAAGISAAIDESRGLDHGAWVPLMLMFPNADIPVTQLSVQSGAGPAHHIAVGRTLAAFRKDNVLIMASGSLVHNLRELAPLGTEEPFWVSEFSDWFKSRLEANDETALCDYRLLAPYARRAHPQEDHILPLFVAYGAGNKAKRLHASTTFGTLRMDAYAFT